MTSHGLTAPGLGHLSLPVQDLDRAARFYTEVLGMRVIASDPAVVHLGAGSTGELALQRGVRCARGEPELHFGFKASSADEVARWQDALGLAQVLGIRVVEQDGGRSLYFRDPDGYMLEIYWYPG